MGRLLFFGAGVGSKVGGFEGFGGSVARYFIVFLVFGMQTECHEVFP